MRLLLIEIMLFFSQVRLREGSRICNFITRSESQQLELDSTTHSVSDKTILVGENSGGFTGYGEVDAVT